MRDNLFLKRIASLGSGAKEKIEKCLGGKVENGDELVKRYSGAGERVRRKVIKQVGAGLLSVLLLCGFVGCNEADEPQITRAEVTSVITTVEPETTKPSQTTKPEETTKPSETTKPEETTKPSETTKPEETTKPSTPETPTTPTEPTTPSTPTTPETPTTPTEPTIPETPTEPETPDVEEDLPSDEDGYQYPEYFANLVHDTIVMKNLFDGKFGEADIEIVFMETAGALAPDTAVSIYARMTTENQKVYYSKFEFLVKSSDYRTINIPKFHDSYASYVESIETALKNQATYKKSNLSELDDKTDEINSTLTENFAKFVDESFVDVEINCVRDVVLSDGYVYAEISGFGYDGDGEASSFILQVLKTGEYYPSALELVEDVNSGERSREDMRDVKLTKKAIDSVYQKQEESQNQ